MQGGTRGVNLEDVQLQEQATEDILRRSRQSRERMQFKSCERQKEQRSVPRISDINLFKDVGRTEGGDTQSLAQHDILLQTKTQSGFNQFGTQAISNINSKYIKRCSHNYTDLNTDKRGHAGCDICQGDQETIPFSMVSSNVRNYQKEETTKNEEHPGDLTIEIYQAKTNFDNMKNENQQLKSQLDLLSKQFTRMEAEK